MRTTIELDDSVVRELRVMAQRRGVSFKAVVNEALRKSLQGASGAASGLKYECPVFQLGMPSAAVNLDKALALAAALEDEETCRELEMRK
jgi:hypothetical protein